MLTPITTVTAAAIKHALAGTRFRARIKGVSTVYPFSACSDAAVVRCSGFRRPNPHDYLSTAPAPSKIALLLAVRCECTPVHVIM